jgi:AcrR family transcriptional regulator
VTTEERRQPAGAAVLRGEITTAIRHAVAHELATVGYGRLSIEAVARRAGVGKTAVYRRWRSKLEMVLELVTEVASRKFPLPDTGSLQGDLELFLFLAGTALRHPLASQIIPDLLAEAARNPEIAQTLQQALQVNQRDIAALLVARAVRRGELSPDIDGEVAADLIVGPLYWRLAVARTPLADDYVGRLATAVRAGLAAGSAPAGASSTVAGESPPPVPPESPSGRPDRVVVANDTRTQDAGPVPETVAASR